ncbi:uncharacterized protein LOC127868060 isoform X2 [Dreissena polymorpha]|uniref:uncharacterized protein LOC127868060 isoform X2 n=1 Tax=Dreissena polymorpha TaxID=45954 RepID=UPI002264D322|nr:uncharacterized protein LOC127868060 isoform X2 [Dreissena polymorpha]
MAEMSTVVEGKVKFREGKKWKPRWCVMKKPSPVADRLIVFLYKDVKDSIKGVSAKSSFPLDGFYGLESGICFDKETSVLAIICQKQITLLAFDSRETLIQFEIKIRRGLGEEHQFPVRTIKVPSHSKLPLDLLRMHIHGSKFCLTGHVPPKILCSWQVSELRRFGAIDGRFCFEGGSRCGKGQGFHVLQTDQVEEISEIIGNASVGKAAPLIKRQTGSDFQDSVKQSSVSNTAFKNFENQQAFVDQNYHDGDNSWLRYKRHSISFTDFRRARHYTEKQRLQSIENVEKERLMAIYDVPPRRIRKVESKHHPTLQEHPRSDNSVRSFDINFNAIRGLCGGQGQVSMQGQENYFNWSGEFNNNVMSYQVPRSLLNQSENSVNQSTTTIACNQSDSTSSQGSLLSLQSANFAQNSMSISSSAPALCGYGSNTLTCNFRQLGQQLPNRDQDERDRLADAQHDDVMRSLDQSQQDLEKEMSLLDEMLQICQRAEGDSDRDQPPPLPAKLSHTPGDGAGSQQGSGSRQGSEVVRNVHCPRGSLDNLSVSSDSTHSRPAPRSHTTNSVLLSPNLVNKLKKIPRRSTFNAPLPYVNLSKYDGNVGNVDSSHVHIPAASTSAPDGSSSWCKLRGSKSQNSQGYDNVPRSGSCRNDSNRVSVSLPGSRENLRSVSSSDLQVNLGTRNNSFSNEPIYSNQREETPPPELPPKGPHLRNRQKYHLDAISRPPQPPRPPERPQVKSRSSGKGHGQQWPIRQGSFSSSQQEDYFLMGSFEKEPTHCKTDFSETCRMSDPITVQQVVNLPPKEKKYTRSSVLDCYMDMSGIMELERGDCSAMNESPSVQRPKYLRSISASGIGIVTEEEDDYYIPDPLPRAESLSISAGNSPKEVRRERAPIREDNYLLMSTLTTRRPSLDTSRVDSSGMDSSRLDTSRINEEEYVKQSQIAASLNRTNSSDTEKQLSFTLDDWHNAEESNRNLICKSENRIPRDMSKIEMPFDNLLDFTLLVSREKDANKLEQVQIKSMTVGAKTDSPSVKTPGFFSRLIRRNSRDRKSVSQSQENLLTISISEPIIKEEAGLAEYTSLSSSENSRAQSQQDIVMGPCDRNRSSSFPNRSSFVAMAPDSNSSSSTGISILSQQSDLCATNSSLSCETVSTRASSNEGNLNDHSNSVQSVLSDSDKQEMGKESFGKHSYFSMGPLDTSNASKGHGNLESHSEHFSRKMEVHDSDQSKGNSDECGGKVFTVLSVQGDSCKTDDEKLIELWHSTNSLSGKSNNSISDLKSKMTLPLEELSPDEKANAIAKHISSLPPFVPPKMKSYPTKLSPVLEKTTPKGDKPDTLSVSSPEYQTCTGVVESPVISPSLKKLQAKATLRITPPSEDENGKIWIPRTFEDPEVEPVDSGTDAYKTSTLVVDLPELGTDNSLSITSLDSYVTYPDKVVRSSPASTILRPRSGREYQKIERRRTHDDSNMTSPLTTPQSPMTGSVFTFDNVATSSIVSADQYSPKLTKNSSSEQASICTRSESLKSPTVFYMNLDFDVSPPDSPLPEANAMELMEPMLNYAEIDLSESGRSELSPSQSRRINLADLDHSVSERLLASALRPSKKSKKLAEPIPIEYSMIDMVATQAASKARKDHAQSRDGTLRRKHVATSASFSTSPSGSSTKERVASLSLSRSERKQSAPFIRSINSPDSANF